jgi:hypothetical protein
LKAAHLVLDRPLLLLESCAELVQVGAAGRGQLGLHAGLEARFGL